MTATGETLQQGTAFSHSAILLVGSRSRILGDARLIGLVGLPVDEPRMMLRYEHLPVATRKMPDALMPSAASIQHRLGASLSVGVGTGIDGIGQHVVNGRVARVDPADVVALVHLQRKRQTFRTEPEPDAAGRTGLGKFGEDAANRRHDSFVWVETDFAVGVAPNNPTASLNLLDRLLTHLSATRTSWQCVSQSPREADTQRCD